MLQPRRICFLIFLHFVLGKAENVYRDPDDGRGATKSLNRDKRDSPEVTTILLIDNDGEFGKPEKPAGLLTSTARTFVNEGATTEFGTQIIGTTLDDGRLYAQILQTSSRVYYGDQKYKPVKNSGDFLLRPTEPVLIFPTRLPDVNINLLKPVKDDIAENLQKTTSEALFGGQNILLAPAMTTDDEKELLENVIRARKNDMFNKRNVDSIKPTKVTQNNLPTFTVKHDFAPSGFSVTPVEVDKEEKKDDKKIRLGKALFGKPTQTKFDTVTYVGFADFVTTVGNTVIVFMPHTASRAPVSELATITPKNVEHKVMSTIKTFMSHSPGMVTSTIPGHSLSMQTAIPTLMADRKSKGIGEDVRSSYLAKEQDLFVNPASLSAAEPSMETLIEPSESTLYSSITRSSQPTEPLATYATTVTRSFNTGGAEKPLGLLKSIGGTKAYNGTTTLFTSLIYGTYAGNHYTQILQTSSSSFYVAEIEGKKATIYFDELVTTPEPITSITEEEELLTTGDDTPTTTESIVRKENKLQEEVEPFETLLPTNEPVSRLVPSTVYKTFTYLTTFFIPSDETSTTTSIRSREVVTSDITYVTKVIDDEWLKSTEMPAIEPTEVNLIENTEAIEPEFQLPVPRVLAPEQVEEASEEPSTTTSEEPTTTSTTTTTTKGKTTTKPTTAEPKTTTTEMTTTEAAATSASTTTELKELVEEKDDDEASASTTTTSSTSLPTTTTESTTTEVTTKGKVALTTPDNLDSEDEEIEVVFKTLYTTYTYLTTFFQETSTSVSSREVVVTNVITSTLQSETIQPTASSVEPSTEIAATDIPDNGGGAGNTLYTTYTYYTTLFDEGSTSVISRTEVVTSIAPTPTISALPSSILQNEDLLKSKFEMLLKEQQKLRTEEQITSVSSSTTADVTTTLPVQDATADPINIKPTATIKRGKYGTIARKLKRPIKLASSEDSGENISTTVTPKLEKTGRTVVRKRVRTKSRPFQKSTTIDESQGITTIHLGPAPSVEYERSETVVTDVTKSTSGGRSQVKRIAPPEPVEKNEKSDIIYEDQISSESNNEEIQPSASNTLLLQTSFTTFTYFTTVYKGSTSSDIISRLETVTNVVTETVAPDASLIPSLSPEDATLPITYFTTFTYWTTLFRDGNTVVTSREETISNVVTPTVEPTIAVIQPTSSVLLEILETSSIKQPTAPSVFVPGFVPSPEPTTVTPESETESPITTKPIEDATEAIIVKNGIEDNIEPTTYYTTYTYFTTSYIGDSTVVKSRLETLTNVVTTTTPAFTEVAENDLQTGRAIAPGSGNKIEGTPSQGLQTGLLSTLVTSSVNDGKTTLYSTDVFGTYIDGLYAKVLESTTKVLTGDEASEVVNSTSVSTASPQKTGVISVNEGSIVDADGVSTTFFTTKAIGTSIDQLYAQVVESTSSVLVDNDKKSALAGLQTQTSDAFKTGLVRLIEGSIIKDDTTTLYESRVIGTVIDGRYAQIIESTSSYKIAPTETITTAVIPTAQAGLRTASPSAVQGSIPDGDEEESDDEEEGSEDGKDRGRVRSRLSFQQKKKTFTPVIRPFSSRARPTFLPKKKTVGVASAQTVTRSNFTPTITATLATKSDGIIGPSRNRFSGRRSSSLASAVEVKPTSTKRFNGRGRSTNNPSSVAPTLSSRGRSSSRVTPTPSLSLSSTRGRGAFRSSSSRASLSSDTLRSTISPARPRLRPTLSGFPGRNSPSSTTSQPPQEPTEGSSVQSDDDELEEDEETHEQDIATPSSTTTTTEDPNLARRNGNPLLRFRKPIVPRASTTTTRPDTTQAPRRGVLNNSRNKQRTAATTTQAPTTTTPRALRTRPVSSYGNRAQLPNRARPTNNLFPPRGLLKKPDEEKPVQNEEEEEEEEYDETDDSNVQETAPQKTETDTRPIVQIRRFDAQRRSSRVRRQTEYGVRSRTAGGYNSRYRRPTTQSSRVQERYDYYDDEPVSTEAPRPPTRSGRTRSRQNTQVAQTSPSPRIRPSPTSSTSRAPFTLREKDVTSSPRNTNFRRGQTTVAPRRRTSNYRTTEATTQPPRKPTRLRPQTSLQTNQRRGYTNQRRPSTTRSRGRYDDDVYTYQQPAFDGTITVTHKIPSEVTIPIVSGKVTEFRNVITAKPSIEVLGPHQYTVTTTNGGTLLFLNSEVTNTLPNGATEVTRFLVHESPTSSVTFTPTTIRGRKTSFSHLVPSTVYEVENLVTTLQPSLSSPLANILLSQLLLGNLNIPKNVGQAPNQEQTPTTEYKTKTTTYVTSVTNHMSTVLPLTFRGKEILTTILDSSINVITATEYITETIVITPTLNPTNQFNSLLLPALLQAQILNPPPQPTALPPLNPLDLLQLTGERSKNNALRESEENLEEEKEEVVSKLRPKAKKVAVEPSTEVVTLYVSGRRPGEFSTVLSTIVGGDSSVRKRETMLDDIERLLVEASEVKQVRVLASQLPSLAESSSEVFMDIEIAPGMSEITVPVSSSEINSETESLESVIGDISLRATEISTPIYPTVAAVVTPKSTKKHSLLSKVPSKRN